MLMRRWLFCGAPATATCVLLAPSAVAQTFSSSPYGLGAGVVSPRGVALGDVNTDGVPDVLVNSGASAGAGKLSVLTGKANGTLNAAVVTNFGAPFGTANGGTALGDFNSDGKLDWCLPTSSSGGAVILTGNGAGGFTLPPQAQIQSIAVYSASYAADFTGDGRLDVLLNSWGANVLTHYPASGSVAFGAPQALPYNTYGTMYGELGIADIDRDRDLDFVNPSAYLPGFVVYTSQAGVFSAPTAYQTGSATKSIQCAKCGDLDEDGFVDVVISDDFLNEIRIFTNQGAGAPGQFLPSTAQPALTVAPGSYNLEVGDVNRDGHVDVAVCQKAPDNLALFLGTGSGTLTQIATQLTGTEPEMVRMADLNADGQADLVTANSGSNNVTVLLNRTPIPAAVTSFGTGTPGCAGRLALCVSEAPAIPLPTLRLTGTGAPPCSLGLFLLGDAADIPGSDPLFLGVKLHVDLFGSSVLIGGDFYADGTGSSFGFLPVPNNPLLSGLTFHFQSLFVEPLLQKCSASFYGLVTSRGLSIAF